MGQGILHGTEDFLGALPGSECACGYLFAAGLGPRGHSSYRGVQLVGSLPQRMDLRFNAARDVVSPFQAAFSF